MPILNCGNTFPAGLDPQDTKEYAVDFNPLLADGVLIDMFSITPEQAAIDAGLEITNELQQGGFVRAFFSVADGNEGDAQWVDGVTYKITYKIVTNEVPAQTFTKYIQLTVKIQAGRP